MAKKVTVRRATAPVVITPTETKKTGFSLNYSVMMVVLLVVASFMVGRLSAQVEYLKGGTGTALAPTNNGAAAAAPTQTGPSVINIEGLKKIAAEVKLDTGKFNKCLDDGKFAKKVTDDQAVGTSLGVSGTPTFYINGVMLVGAYPETKFSEIIDAELKDKSGDKVEGVEGRKEVKNGVGLVKGNKNAPVKIVEFSDFECPFCHRAFATVNTVAAKYGDKVSIEYRHYPLSFHPNAQKAGEAYECAIEQGKGWEMHDAMFKAQGA